MSDFEPTQSSARAKLARDADSKITSKVAPPAPGPAKSRSASPQSEGIADRLQDLAKRRIAIESVSPEIDGGRFPARAIVGIPFRVEADIFCDGHDKIDAALLTRPLGSQQWTETPMVLLENDRWRGHATFETNQFYEYTVIAWRDLFASWRAEVSKKHAAGQNLSLELEEGRRILLAAEKGPRAKQAPDAEFEAILAALRDSTNDGDRFSILMSESLAARLRRVGERTNLSQYELTLQVFVDRERAGFSAWYELMPRSQSGMPGRHGTFDDVVRRLPYVRDLGFDVLYFPPIHPVGKTNRKGRNNSLVATTDDPGSPYAIGSSEGGHDAIHPALGNFDDFARLIAAAREHGLEIALDFAIQCSPDHPWIKEHPEWFDWRPDGTIKFAENPPKKYEDIVNVHFYRGAIPGLWYALRDIVTFWVDHGVKIFRVDNPHTKPFPFWEWMIGEVRAKHPDVIFLAEAFTRPKVMKRLAKVGFGQSYSYFTWRNTKAELQEYLTELTQTACKDYMRPNFFANTPDINPYFLQQSGRAGFQIRALLAAALGGNYGIYSGFELCEADAIPGKEEYLNSEKYEIRAWDWDRPGHIKADIRLLNEIRRNHPAMRDFTNIKFYNAWNDSILYFGKRTPDLSSFLLFAVNLDPHNTQGAHFEVPLWEFGLPDDAVIEAEDLVVGGHFVWRGKVQHVSLPPAHRPYAIWRLIPPREAR